MVRPRFPWPLSARSPLSRAGFSNVSAPAPVAGLMGERAGLIDRMDKKLTSKKPASLTVIIHHPPDPLIIERPGVGKRTGWLAHPVLLLKEQCQTTTPGSPALRPSMEIDAHNYGRSCSRMAAILR